MMMDDRKRLLRYRSPRMGLDVAHIFCAPGHGASKTRVNALNLRRVNLPLQGEDERRAGASATQYTTTLRMLFPACIRSNAVLMSESGMEWVIIGSISILPCMYQSTILGTSVRPRAPPKAVPRHTRPVTS